MIKRHVAAVALAAFAGLLCGPAARAQDVVYTKDNPKGIKGKVEDESARGVKLAGRKELIPAENIEDIVYEVEPLEIRVNAYRRAVIAEQEAARATKEGARKAALQEALQKYQQVLAGLKAGQRFPQRHIEFRIAYLLAGRAEDNPGDAEA